MSLAPEELGGEESGRTGEGFLQHVTRLLASRRFHSNIWSSPSSSHVVLSSCDGGESSSLRNTCFTLVTPIYTLVLLLWRPSWKENTGVNCWNLLKLGPNRTLSLWILTLNYHEEHLCCLVRTIRTVTTRRWEQSWPFINPKPRAYLCQLHTDTKHLLVPLIIRLKETHSFTETNLLFWDSAHSSFLNREIEMTSQNVCKYICLVHSSSQRHHCAETTGGLCLDQWEQVDVDFNFRIIQGHSVLILEPWKHQSQHHCWNS